MKTINLQNTLKVFLFFFLLCSANSFGFTQIPSAASSSGNESRTSFVSKPASMSKTTSKANCKTSKTFAMQAKGKKFFKK